MNPLRRAFHMLFASCLVFSAGAALAQTADKPFEPIVGQAGKDVIWVPTPAVLVEKMLDIAKVTPQDYVMDLGSGDGRNIIAAARRGAQALGVEYNPQMVEFSRRVAAKEGLAEKAKFIEGDMYEADISQASVLALFLLTENLNKLAPKFMNLKPGARIVMNGFIVDGWEADETARAEGDCGSWCTAYLYIVPARVAGTWKLPQGELTLEQKYQMVSGNLSSGGASTPITGGRLRGDQITFSAGGVQYSGRVSGNTITGANGAWSATRANP